MAQALDGVEVVVRYLAGLPNKTTAPRAGRLKLIKPLPVARSGSEEIQPWRGAVPAGNGFDRRRRGRAAGAGTTNSKSRETMMTLITKHIAKLCGCLLAALALLGGGEAHRSKEKRRRPRPIRCRPKRR